MQALEPYLRGFLVHLDVERGLSPHTLDAYGRDCRNFLAFLIGLELTLPERLNEKAVFEFLIHERTRGRDVPSVRRTLSAVRTFCRFLVRERVLDHNPAQNLENARQWRHLPNVLEEGEVIRLLQAAVDHPSRYPLRDQALLEILYATGLRVSEVCGLRPEDVRRDVGIVRCRGKGGKERIVPVSQTCLAALDRYEAAERPRLARGKAAAPLFLSRSGRVLGREVVCTLVGRYSRLAGVPGLVTTHTMRHTFATHLLRGGADLRVVQEILGHAKLETTEIYTHIERSDLKAQHRKFHPRG